MWARYQVIRDIGINSLVVVMYVEFENTKGVLRPKPSFFPSFNERMRVVKKLGFKSPVVLRTFWDYLTLEADPNPLTEDKRTYTEPARDIYRQHLYLTAKEARKHQWLDYIYYEVDEPGSTAKRAKFFRTSKVIKAMGNKVFCTILDSDDIKELIDYRCFNGIDYTCLAGRERARELRRDADADGDVFWFYGGGSYAYLEGVICGIRYLNGLFLWRTRAVGVMNHVACSGDVDDFGKKKAYCTYYPSCHPDDPLAPTMQWEGIREGVDDYKYLYTLMAMARGLMLSGDQEIAATAQRVRTDMETRLNSLPWRHARGATYPPQDITNGDLRQVRQEIIRSILDLLDLQKKEQESTSPLSECTRWRNWDVTDAQHQLGETRYEGQEIASSIRAGRRHRQTGTPSCSNGLARKAWSSKER